MVFTSLLRESSTECENPTIRHDVKTIVNLIDVIPIFARPPLSLLPSFFKLKRTLLFVVRSPVPRKVTKAHCAQSLQNIQTFRNTSANVLCAAKKIDRDNILAFFVCPHSITVHLKPNSKTTTDK